MSNNSKKVASLTELERAINVILARDNDEKLDKSPSFTSDPVIGELWSKPGEHTSRTSSEDIYSTFKVRKSSGLDLAVTLGLFRCLACGGVHVNLFVDTHLLFSLKIAANGEMSVKPGYEVVENPSQEKK